MNYTELNTGSLPGLLDYVADLTFNVPGLDIDVPGLTSEVPGLRPGQTRPNLSPAFTTLGVFEVDQCHGVIQIGPRPTSVAMVTNS